MRSHQIFDGFGIASVFCGVSMIFGGSVWWPVVACGSFGEGVWVARGGLMEARETLVVSHGGVSGIGTLRFPAVARGSA